MAKYLLIESRDPFESSEVGYFSDLASDLAQRAERTTFFLVQNGVLAARPGAKSNERIKRLLASKVEVLSDGFAMRERAIGRPMDGVDVADMDRLLSLLLEAGTKTIWH